MDELNLEQVRLGLSKRVDEFLENDDKVSKDKINKFSKDFLDFFSYMTIMLLNSSSTKNRHTSLFFGNIIVLLNRQVDYFLPAAAAVGYKNNRLHLYLNPLILVQYTIDNIIAVLIHECYHILNLHISRSEKYINKKIDFQLINIAADAAINQFINNLSEGCVTLNTIKEATKLNYIKPEQEFEYYLKLLLDNKENVSNFISEHFPNEEQII